MKSVLEELALNLRSSWNHRTDLIWRQLDPELWRSTHNPWAVLQAVSHERLESVLKEKPIKKLIDELSHVERAPSWFENHHPKSPLSPIAYFSMEYMLSEALPIYSGGLGNVAGDQLKAASDLGVPVIAIGLLYSQGYFRQLITASGEQQEFYPYNDPGQLPIRPKRLPNGEWLRLKIDLPGWPLWLRTSEAKVGNRTLYLLDSNDIANLPAHRGVTSELYGGDQELRLKQEMVLGIGGWRLLHALGIEPEVCHMNEGHAAFAVLERASCLMKKEGLSFEVAQAATRVGNHFTTHTAVEAGFDRFSPDLIERYLGRYAEIQLGISPEQLLALGQLNPGDPFNMAYLAIRGSGSVNGVSRLHGEVSRALFKGLFPRFPEEEVPIGYVTNGVHMPSWDSAAADHLWTEACGKERWHGRTEELEKKILALSEEEIWQMRSESRSHLVDYARTRLARQLEARGGGADEVELAATYLNPEVLTIGFARRFASYKRPTLLLFDEERLLRILTDRERPVQLIIAGKAHPADEEGHALIKRWMEFIYRSEARSSVVFLSDYDMLLTGHLVQGVDLWLNTPRRPWEACGTSGMKVLVNGGINLSELDGWWAEAYTPQVGWALGDGDNPGQDEVEASALYDLLEQEVIPEFYARDHRGIPLTWTAKIRESMARLTPYYSSNRAVREYTESYYLPGAERYRRRTANHGALAKAIVDWERSLEEHWGQLKFGEQKVETKEGQHRFEIHVDLKGLDRQAVRVELYSPQMVQEMEYRGGDLYGTEVPALSPASNFTPRIVPYHPEVAVPLESARILWSR